MQIHKLIGINMSSLEGNAGAWTPFNTNQTRNLGEHLIVGTGQSSEMERKSDQVGTSMGGAMNDVQDEDIIQLRRARWRESWVKRKTR